MFLCACTSVISSLFSMRATVQNMEKSSTNLFTMLFCASEEENMQQ